MKYEPVVSEEMNKIEDQNVVYIYCQVGQRDYWKDQKNEFRTDKQIQLTGVPTLMKWGNSAVKLVEDQLKQNLIQMMIEDEDS